MNAHLSLHFGHVLWFMLTDNHGYLRIRIGDHDEDLPFSLDSQRLIVDGLDAPRFSPNGPNTSEVPQSGLPVAVAIATTFEFWENHWRTRRSSRRVVKVTGWNYWSEYAASQKRIASRPTMRIVRVTYWKGHPTSQPEEVIVQGTLAELAEHVESGKLSTKQMDFTYNYRVEEKTSNNDWKRCDDEIATSLKLPVWHYEVSAAPVAAKPTVAMPKSNKARSSVIKDFGDLQVKVAVNSLEAVAA